VRATWVVLAVAAALRAAVVAWLGDTVPYSDYFYYHEAGRMQAADWRFLFRHETVVQYAKLNWWPPGYPLFLAGLYALFGPDPRVAAWTQVGLGVAVCALAMAIAGRACGRRSGLAAGWIVALDPTLVFTTNLVAAENLFVPLVTAGLWCAGTARTPRRFAAAGALLGAASLVRAAGLCIPVVVATWAWRRAAGRNAPRLAAPLAVLIGAFALIAPWTVRNAVVAGHPALVCFGGGLNFYFGHNDVAIGYRDLASTPLAGLGDAAAIDRRGVRLGLESLQRHPFGFVTRGVRKVGSLFAPPADALHANTAIESPPAAAAADDDARRARRERKERLLHGPFTVLAAVHVYVLVAAAAVVLVRRRRRVPDEIRLSGWIAAAWVAVHIVFWAQPRFRIPLDVPLALVAAAGLAPAPSRRVAR
jgi:hypothetical protein